MLARDWLMDEAFFTERMKRRWNNLWSIRRRFNRDWRSMNGPIKGLLLDLIKQSLIQHLEMVDTKSWRNGEIRGRRYKLGLRMITTEKKETWGGLRKTLRWRSFLSDRSNWSSHGDTCYCTRRNQTYRETEISSTALVMGCINLISYVISLLGHVNMPDTCNVCPMASVQWNEQGWQKKLT